MSIRFDNRVVIITGSGGGLGRVYALNLAALGAKVVVNDPGGAVDGRGGDGSAADKVVAEIKAKGGTAIASYDSVATMAGAQGIIDTAMKAYGRIDALINNAGILRDKSFGKMDIADFETVFNVHFMGSVYCTKAAWPVMVEQKFGRIVLTTSMAGLVGNFGQANYGAAKTAMLGLMNVLKQEGAKSDIKVNCISPVAGETRMGGTVADPKLEPIMKYVRAEYVSPAVEWLASEQCNVSGEIVGASGGYYTAVRFYRTPGVLLPNETVPSVDDFAAATAELFNFEKPEPFVGTMREFMRLMQKAGKFNP
jgi:NAD(P)-dependent dehydrogenase (short-subunit alcohol dehydrogenase family)